MCTDPIQSVGEAIRSQVNPHVVLHEVGDVEVLRLDPVDALTVTTLMDNALDLFMPDQGVARRVSPFALPGVVPNPVMVNREVPDALVAEHGFSMLLTVTKDGHDHRLLFDAGTSPMGVVENVRRLGIDPTEIEVIVCSHGHFDHTAGLAGLLSVLGARNLPIVIHPHFFRERRVAVPGVNPWEMPTTSASALREAGLEVTDQPRPSFVLDGAVLVTGEVPRVTGYEPGFPPQQAWLDGSWRPDPLVLDDQAVIVNVRDKGLVVLTGCGHAGVVNIARYARRLTGDQPLHAVIGGFHLNGPTFEPLISKVLDDLAALDPQVLVPAHCTGWRAQHAMAARFGDAFVPDAVGTRFHF